MTALATFDMRSIEDGYTGVLLDALIVDCPALPDWLDAPVPILPQQDCTDMGLNLPQSEVLAGWRCQPLGLLLTYHEVLLSEWGFDPNEAQQVYGCGAPLDIKGVFNRAMHLVHITVAMEVFMKPKDHGFAWMNFARAEWGDQSPKQWMLDGRLDGCEAALMEQLRNER